MHVVYLIFNGSAIWLLCRPKLNLPLEDGIAAIIMSSQKSAPVAVTVISYLTNDGIKQGLFAIPAIIGQIAQIFMGIGLAKYFAHLVAKEQRDWCSDTVLRTTNLAFSGRRNLAFMCDAVLNLDVAGEMCQVPIGLLSLVVDVGLFLQNLTHLKIK